MHFKPRFYSEQLDAEQPSSFSPVSTFKTTSAAGSLSCRCTPRHPITSHQHHKTLMLSGGLSHQDGQMFLWGRHSGTSLVSYISLSGTENRKHPNDPLPGETSNTQTTHQAKLAICIYWRGRKGQKQVQKQNSATHQCHATSVCVV